MAKKNTAGQVLKVTQIDVFRHDVYAEIHASEQDYTNWESYQCLSEEEHSLIDAGNIPTKPIRKRIDVGGWITLPAEGETYDADLINAGYAAIEQQDKWSDFSITL